MRKHIENSGQSENRLPVISYTLTQASQATGFSERTIRRIIARGLLRKAKATRRIIITHAELERFFKEVTA